MLEGDGVPPSSSMTGTGSNAGAADASSTGALCTGAGVSSRAGPAVDEEDGREVPAEPAETGEGVLVGDGLAAAAFSCR